MTKKTIILFISLFYIISCSDNLKHLPGAKQHYLLTSVQQLKDSVYCQEIEAFYEKGTEGSFTGKSGIDIYYKLFRPEEADAAIMISTGRTEAAIKYKELIFDLCRNGYAVLIHDHRGQGLSGRMAEDPEMGYIDSFQFYIDDMKTFYDDFMKSGAYEKKYLLAHSMGGAIGMSYLEQYPWDFHAASFCSPMLGLKAPTCPLVKILSGKKPRYGIGQGKYNDDKLPFSENHVTGSEIRFKRGIAAYAKVPEARLGGASYQWANKSCEHIKQIRRNMKDIRTPFILFSAQNEVVVNPKSHRKFVEKARKLDKVCEAYSVDDAQHEILMEKDRQRTQVISASLNFFAAY